MNIKIAIVIPCYKAKGKIGNFTQRLFCILDDLKKIPNQCLFS